MDERRDPLTNAPDEGELLAAYLDGETDDVTSARIERRLHTDPTVAAKLDALAHVRARLQRLDEVEPPAGFGERLDARLRSERAQGRPATPPATSMQPAKARRTSRASRLMPFAVAASLLLLAVLGGAALLSVRTGGGGESVSAEFEANADGAEARDAPMAAPEEEAAGEEADGGGATTAVEQAAPDSARGLPDVATDRDIVGRLQQQDQAADDPVSREAELRARAGLPASPTCLDDLDATAVDLVERDGQQVLSALITDGGGPQVVLFDPRTCERIRTFQP